MKSPLPASLEASTSGVRTAIWPLAAGILLLGVAAACSGPPVFAPAPVEQALLGEDWTKVADLLANVTPQTPDPVLRLIKGHACLALNANNEALGLFLSLRDQGDLSRCRAWATRFAKENSCNATAHYFQGDVLSRRGERDAAVKSLTKALEISPGHLLARHARAVVYATYATEEKFQAASDDFRAALEGRPGLAELFVSHATYIVQKRADAQKALEDYEQALKISPDYVLALNGRGAMLVLLQRLPEAEADLEKARQLSVGGLAEMASVAEMNLGALTGKINEGLERKLAVVAGWKPGMSVDEKMRLFDTYDRQTQQSILDAAANARAWNDRNLGNFMMPSSITGGIQGGIAETLIGPTAHLDASFGATWDRQPTMHNRGVQDDFLKAAAQQGLHPNFEATNPVDNIKSFLNNQFGPAHDFSHPGGVSSREIASGVDRGDWNVFMSYGLLYKVQAGV